MTYKIYRSLPGTHVVAVRPRGYLEALERRAAGHWGTLITRPFGDSKLVQRVYPEGKPEGIHLFVFSNLRKARAFMRQAKLVLPFEQQKDPGLETELVLSIKSPGKEVI